MIGVGFDKWFVNIGWCIGFVFDIVLMFSVYV